MPPGPAGHRRGRPHAPRSVYGAFARQATRPADPRAERTAVTRPAAAIRGAPPDGSPEAVAAPVNAALDAWEVREPEIRGPRVRRLDLGAGKSVLRPA